MPPPTTTIAALMAHPRTAGLILELFAAASIAWSNILAWAQTVEVGATTTTISIVGGGIVGLLVIGIRKVNDERIRFVREMEDERLRAAERWEAINKDSLTKEIKDLKAMVKESHRRLTETKAEHTAREQAYREDVRQLREQIEGLHETLDRRDREVERLMRAVGGVVRSTDNLARTTEGLKQETEGLKQEIRESGAPPAGTEGGASR